MAVVTIRSSNPYDSNIFLIEGDRPILVDSGTGQGSEEVIRHIRSACPDGPSLIVATHCHYDHAGGLHDLVETFGCPVYAGWKDAPVIRHPDSRDVAALFGAAMRPVDVLDLREGDVLDSGSHRFTVLETPGHTEGSIDLMKLAALSPYAVLCELTNPDGSMAKGVAIERFAAQFDYPIVTISDIIHYRRTFGYITQYEEK